MAVFQPDSPREIVEPHIKQAFLQEAQQSSHKPVLNFISVIFNLLAQPLHCGNLV